MKRNNYIAIALMAASMALTTGCSDSFLEVTNPTGEPLEEYYTTDAHIQEALAAAYDPTHWPDWGLGQYNALNIDAEILGDNVWVGGSNKADMQNWHMLFNFEADENNTLSSLWTVDYSGVKRCNDVLKYLDWAALTPENRTSYEMQARALRVYYYNNLWHYFGNVPFYLENLSDPYTAPQLTADEVYNQLIVELEAVISSNTLPMAWDEKNSGRVSQAMVYMMYAEMVMYQNDTQRYPKALEYMQAIIGDSHYGLLPNYGDIWKESGEWSKESIWEVNYEDNNNERGWSSPLAIGGTVMPTLISPNGFHYLAEYGLDGDGWGFMPIRVETYDMYDPADKRRDETCLDVRGKATYTERYQDTHIWLKKYIAQNENNKDAGFDNNLNYNNNLRVYRFSETLLNAAELILSSNKQKALEYVNMVHQRAGLSALTDVNIDDIIQERRLEFVGEGKRYWDLVRTGKAATVLVADKYGYRTNSWTESKKYIPIAQSELDSDPALKQNEYK